MSEILRQRVLWLVWSVVLLSSLAAVVLLNRAASRGAVASGFPPSLGFGARGRSAERGGGNRTDAIARYGFSREEFLGMTIADIRPPEDVPALVAIVRALDGTGLRGPTLRRHRHKDGTLLTALVTAQHDRIVASYAVLAAVGSLEPQILGLHIEAYDPMVHYQQVRDTWIGVRTPDGR